MAISMADVGEPTQNGYAERLMRTIKEEHVDLTEYMDYHDAYQQSGRFLDEVYMHRHIHSSLGYLTPAEFENQWRATPSAACFPRIAGPRNSTATPRSKALGRITHTLLKTRLPFLISD